jgi:hypothetical protein
MTSFRIRPRFTYLSRRTPESIQDHLQAEWTAKQPDCLLEMIPGHAVLKISPEHQHYWSPQLSLNLEWDEFGGETTIRGLYGPNPNVWALFFFSYAALGILAVFIGIIGFANLSLDKAAPILWVLPVLGIIAVVLYVFSQFGQKLGAEQTYELHHFFESAIGERVHIQ